MAPRSLFALVGGPLALALGSFIGRSHPQVCAPCVQSG
jgi:hypothetical protein